VLSINKIIERDSRFKLLFNFSTIVCIISHDINALLSLKQLTVRGALFMCLKQWRFDGFQTTIGFSLLPAAFTKKATVTISLLFFHLWQAFPKPFSGKALQRQASSFIHIPNTFGCVSLQYFRQLFLPWHDFYSPPITIVLMLCLPFHFTTNQSY